MQRVLPQFDDARGSLCVVETGKDIDFVVKRAYYMFDIPSGAARGAHGHRRLRHLIIAVHGRFEVVVDDGFNQTTFVLDHPRKGLYMGPMVWRDMINFAPGTVGLWLVADHYDEAEYYRDYRLAHVWSSLEQAPETVRGRIAAGTWQHVVGTVLISLATIARVEARAERAPGHPERQDPRLASAVARARRRERRT